MTAPGGVRPGWPALMDRDTASSYLEMSPETFEAITARAKVRPVDLGVRLLRWRRRDLDALIDSLPQRGGELTPEAANQPDPAQTALEKAKRRARR